MHDTLAGKYVRALVDTGQGIFPHGASSMTEYAKGRWSVWFNDGSYAAVDCNGTKPVPLALRWQRHPKHSAMCRPLPKVPACSEL